MPFEAKQPPMGLSNSASAFTNAQNQHETSAPAANGGNGNGTNGIPLTVQGAIAQGLNMGGMGFQFPNSQYPIAESFMQRSPAEQAQAAYAAAAMAEKRLAMSNRGIDKKDTSENNSLDAGSGLPATIGPSNGTSNSYTSDAMNQVNMLMGSAAPASNFAMNPAFAQMLGFPGVQGFFNQANGATPGANGMPQNLLAQAGYGGYQLPQGLDAMGFPGNANLAGSALPSAFASIANPNQVPITSTSSPTGIMPVAPIPQKKKKEKGKPKRPLSAYNLFFKHERQRILASLSKEAEQEEESEKNDATKDDADKDKDQDSSREDDKKVKEEDQSSASDNKSSAEDKVSDKEKDQPPPPEGQDEKDLALAAAKKKKPHGKIGFETLAKTIGQRWAKLEADELKKYKDLANEDMKRYKSEMELFLTKKQDIDAQERINKAAESQAPGNATIGNEAKAFDQQFQMQLLQQQAAQANPWGAAMSNSMNPAQGQNFATNPSALQNSMLMQALLMQQMNQQQQQQQQQHQQPKTAQLRHPKTMTACADERPCTVRVG